MHFFAKLCMVRAYFRIPAPSGTFRPVGPPPGLLPAGRRPKESVDGGRLEVDWSWREGGRRGGLKDHREALPPSKHVSPRTFRRKMFHRQTSREARKVECFTGSPIGLAVKHFRPRSDGETWDGGETFRGMFHRGPCVTNVSP